MVVDSENNTNASPTKHNVINIRYFYILNNYLYLIYNIFFKKKKKKTIVPNLLHRTISK